MNKWYDSDNPSTVVRGATWRGVVWVLAILLVVGLVSVGIWGFKVATSDVKGQGDAIQTKNTGTNRIRAQEEYVQTWNNILAADKRVQVMFDAKTAEPSTVNNTNYVGSVNFCIQAVADYDALYEKYTSADFRPDGYPEKIDPLNSETDCKESTT